MEENLIIYMECPYITAILERKKDHSAVVSFLLWSWKVHFGVSSDPLETYPSEGLDMEIII